ncbi:unnamed protein product [Symbiodinium sp. CCMP2592]|nr:unnamed protein product [Symbiodinium sp. CCMP2592]
MAARGVATDTSLARSKHYIECRLRSVSRCHGVAYVSSLQATKGPSAQPVVQHWAVSVSLPQQMVPGVQSKGVSVRLRQQIPPAARQVPPQHSEPAEQHSVPPQQIEPGVHLIWPQVKLPSPLKPRTCSGAPLKVKACPETP